MSFRHRAAGHLDNVHLVAPIQFAPCSTGIRTDVIADNIRYAIRDIRFDDVSYGGRTNRIAVGNLGIGKSCSLFSSKSIWPVFLL